MTVVADFEPTAKMHFSNDGLTFSPYESLEFRRYDWDLFLFGGNNTTGLKTIYTQFKDKYDNESEIAVLGTVFYTRPPRIRVNQPIQRIDGSRLVDIPIIIYDDESDIVSVVGAEYSLSGTFEDARPMAFRTSDPAHDSMSAISSSPTGQTANFVWDAAADDSQALTYSARVRMSPQFLDSEFQKAESPHFNLNTLSSASADPSLRAVRGESVDLTVTYRNQSGVLFNPTTVKLLSVLDTNGFEKLGSPATVLPASAGVFTYSFPIAEVDVLGTWEYVYESTVGLDITTDTFEFLVIDKVVSSEAPDVASTCRVFGRILEKSGKPAVGMSVIVLHTDSTRTYTNKTITEIARAQTNAFGEFSIDIKHGLEVTIEIKGAGQVIHGTVPATTSLDYLLLS